MASSTSPPAWHEPSRIAGLWAGILAGPIVWLMLLEFNYVMSYVPCETRHTWFLHAAVAMSVVLVGGAAWLARRSAPADQRDADALAIDTVEHPSRPLTRVTAETRARWMSAAGVWLSLWFVLVILTMEIPIVVLETCQ